MVKFRRLVVSAADADAIALAERQPRLACPLTASFCTWPALRTKKTCRFANRGGLGFQEKLVLEKRMAEAKEQGKPMPKGSKEAMAAYEQEMEMGNVGNGKAPMGHDDKELSADGSESLT